MLKTLRQHPLLAGAGEILADTVRYIAAVLVVLMVLRQLAKIVP